jgi:hypothetical protein
MPSVRHVAVVLGLGLTAPLGPAALAQTASPTPAIVGEHVVAIAATDVNASTLVVASTAGGPFWPGGPRPTDPAQFTWPAGATADGIAGPSDPRYAPAAGSPYDGVARLLVTTSKGTFGCTAALIDDRHLLSSGHCVAPAALGAAPTSVIVSFLAPGGGLVSYVVAPDQVAIMPGYGGSVVDERDLSILTLGVDAAPWIPRYHVYTDNPLFQPILEVGFGSTGNGVTGDVVTAIFDPVPTRRVGLNRWEVTRDASFFYVDAAPVTRVLVADFDGADPGGTYAVARRSSASNPASLVTGWAPRTLFQNDANCRLLDGVALDPVLVATICQSGYGLDEVLTGAGDSGGPAFILAVDGTLRLAGVASFGNVACVPDQRLDAAGVPAPRTDAGCPAGFVQVGGRFGMRTGHVFAGGDIEAAFIAAYAPTAFTPEPATWMLVASGLSLLAWVRRAKRCR